MRLGDRELDLSQPQVMAIINVTDDSFFEGSRTVDEQSIASRAKEAIASGATILDVGGYSSRPGAKELSVDEEWERVRKGLRGIKDVAADAFVSVDTFRSEVVRVYVVIIVAATLCIGASLYFAGIYPNILTSLRQSVFQVVSLISTTGFATANTNLWTPFAIVILIILSIICGCAGSTSGGVKVDRVLLYGKVLKARLRGQQHPNAIIRIRLDGIVQEERQVNAVTLFLTTYFVLILVATLTSTLFGLDLLTAFSSSVAFIGNVGPGFGEVGSYDNYAMMPSLLKIQGTILMLMGRLEIFGFIQFLFIRMWR